jgi:23S rRNA (cytosine1962-C5)-methyltransferase
MDILDLHPSTIKSLKNGHPWITKDKYTNYFPDKPLLKIREAKTGNMLGHFIHDPEHPKIKARFWGKEAILFQKELLKRLWEALEKRRPLLSSRENLYLTFGEVDQLPGLYVQLLGDNLLIGYHAFFWQEHVKDVARFFKRKLKVEKIWVQKRLPGEKKEPPTPLRGETTPNFTVKEGELTFNLKLDQGHDIGLYTDMAAIREQLVPYFEKSETILNLFSYTGAFSLMGLKKGKEVTSVDLSKSYMSWLEENIETNGFNIDNHTSMVGPCAKVIKKLDKKFDLIISDPPSFSTDGKKRTSCLDFYKKELKNLLNLLNDDGHLILFLNTHSINRRKFKNTIRELLGSEKIIRDLYLSKDCPILKNFPEGDYLKGLIIKKTGPLHF